MSQQHVFRHESCGSVMTIDITSTDNPAQIVEDCFRMCDVFEERYSRFKTGNRLDQINQQQNIPIALNDEDYFLVKHLLALAEKTRGAFDPTIISTLESYGYDKNYSFERSENKPIGYTHISLGDHTMTLTHGVRVEFGSIGKGYLADRVAERLQTAGFSHFMVDFGGDMISSGSYKVGLENPFDISQIIGTIIINGFAIAASNGARRRKGDFHHLLDPHTGKPVRDIAGVYIAAASCMMADLYSTAVFVSGAEGGKKLLMETDEITGLIVFSDGSYRKKTGYPGELFTN